MEQLITIGAGKMGSLISGSEAVSLRQTESFVELLKGRDFVLLATRQEAGLCWLKANSDLLASKTVISLMAFVSFEALEKAVDNKTVRFLRIMTDTSLQSISWSDDGYLSQAQKESVEKQLSRKGHTEYLGAREDEKLLAETIKACQLGWIAQALNELTLSFDERILDKVLEQHRAGLSFASIAGAVATSGGATEAGINATNGLFTEVFKKQALAGFAKANEKGERFTNFVQGL